MRILHFSTEDITGGAGKAAHRLHTALHAAGCDSRMIVLRKRSEDERVVQAAPPRPRPWQSRWQRLRDSVPGLRPQPLVANYKFNFDLAPRIDEASLLQFAPGSIDIICLHWINELLDTRLLGALAAHYRAPLVWIAADQEPVTGGCHYSFGCDGFTRECGRCPQLDSNHTHDHSHEVWQRKQQHLSRAPLYFVAPTTWVAARIRASSLFRHHRIAQIPYAIDTETFRPIDRRIARDLLRLPPDKKIVFFGATYLEDCRKGMRYLLDALEGLRARLNGAGGMCPDDLFMIAAGHNGRAPLSGLPFAGKYLGHLDHDLLLALAYQAADLFLCPSVEDAGPMMIPEAMLCGTPVVAFNTGGAPDVIDHGRNGYLAAPRDSADLAHGLHMLLVDDDQQALSQAARAAAERLHQPATVAARHLDLYESLVHGPA